MVRNWEIDSGKECSSVTSEAIRVVIANFLRQVIRWDKSYIKEGYIESFKICTNVLSEMSGGGILNSQKMSK